MEQLCNELFEVFIHLFLLQRSQSKNVQLNALSDSCRIYGSSQSANESVMIQVDKYFPVNHIEHLWFVFI